MRFMAARSWRRTGHRVRGVLSSAVLFVSWPAAGQSPSSTPPLPADLVVALRAAGCRIPNAPSAYGPDSSAVIAHVAYHAAVRTPSSADWIVVCERASRRAVLVFPAPLRRSDGPALTLPISWSPKEPGCEGWIDVADSTWVRAALGHAVRDGRRQLLTAEERRSPLHAGILESMCEGGDLRYWTGRRWISLPAYGDAR